MIKQVKELIASKHQGLFHIEAFKDGQCTYSKIIYNRLTDQYLNAVADSLLGTNPDYGIEYIAVGTSDAAIDDTDTQLGNEIYRIAPSSGPTRIATGIVQTKFIISKTSAVATLEEIAIFCGSTASGSANTGKILSRILWHYEKTISDEIHVTRLDKVVRG